MRNNYFEIWYPYSNLIRVWNIKKVIEGYLHFDFIKSTFAFFFFFHFFFLFWKWYLHSWVDTIFAYLYHAIFKFINIWSYHYTTLIVFLLYQWNKKWKIIIFLRKIIEILGKTNNKMHHTSCGNGASLT